MQEIRLWDKWEHPKFRLDNGILELLTWDEEGEVSCPLSKEEAKSVISICEAFING